MVKSMGIKTVRKNWIGRYFAWAVLLIVPALLMLRMETMVMGEIGHQTPDARLYLSIADNFVKTGHFIQRARQVKGMVVPPGTPLMLTIYRLLHFSNQMILYVHILMFGIANILLYETERRICGRGLWAPIIYTMANLRCWIILGDAIVEHYYLFLLCLALWVMYRDMSEQKKIVSMNLIGLAMLLVRPLLGIVYFAVLAYSFWWYVKNRRLKIGIGIVLLPLLVLGLNVAVNYRETGEIILLENYSGSDIYVASRVDSPVTIEAAEQFMDETYLRIVQDDTLSQTERNNIFKSLAANNLRDHFGHYLWNGIQRGYEIFLKAYAWATLYTLAGGIILARKEKSEGNQRSFIILLLVLSLAVVSSFGVSEVRYSIVIWPVAALHGAYLTQIILSRIFARRTFEKNTISAGE